MTNGFFTKRMLCRSISEKDICLLTSWFNSQEAHGDFLTVEPSTIEENIEKFQNQGFWNEKSKTYIIELKENNIPIGTMRYWTKIENIKTALMAIKIATPEYRGQGYGTEAQKALIRELFKKYQYNTVEMYTDINNLPQQKCLGKLDFENIHIESYQDGKITRQGCLYRLTKDRYEKSGVHIYYYE